MAIISNLSFSDVRMQRGAGRLPTPHTAYSFVFMRQPDFISSVVSGIFRQVNGRGNFSAKHSVRPSRNRGGCRRQVGA